MIFLFEQFAYSEKILQSVLPLEKKGGKAFGKEVKGDANFALENAPKDFLANLSMWVCSSIAQ